ncbi:phospholipase [Psychromonas sp. psych-6C06]|uniref:phospholipase A n=1 Tax=Psychromonas sp. psych-6C06 TaxID=2058089 RepID=UPI000C327DB4|nr:phospholipase A [Psychromonas sp. psych-6C06]PKF60875.1 phospholipase [Psychromonas sp. psych-6C06]
MRLLLSLAVFMMSFTTFAAESVIDQRLKKEKAIKDNKFAIIPYQPTYILPFVFNDKISSNSSYPLGADGENEFEPIEMQFQISFKIPVWTNIADLPLSLNFAYTQLSIWQAYNTEKSSPFRETNYEPEIFATWQQDASLGLGWTFKMASIGFTHQSNGRSEPLSRSWNRLNSYFIIENNNLAVSINPWYRFSEAASSDNNPDLTDYYGHGKIRLIYKYNQNTFSLMSRNNLESGFSKGAVEAAWSFPIHDRVRGYFKVFSGYGNSMIEYDHYTNTIGLGISLTDWL